MTDLACPLCKAALREVNREGVAIDVCGQCRGIWLDRGELEKLLSMARQPDESFLPAQAQQGRPPQPYQGERGQSQPYQGERGMRRDYDDDDDDRHRHYGGGKHYRKKSRFESIFDIFD